MARRRRISIIPVLALLVLRPAIVRAAEPSPADAMLARLKALTGTWRGRAQWSGGRTESYELTASYAVTGHGTAVVESLGSEGETVMTSVYHEDGADLRVTHYCGAGNQPRLKSTRIDPEKRTVRFGMIDMTGRPGPHVGEIELEFVDDDHLTLRFTFLGGKVPSIENIDLVRSPK